MCGCDVAHFEILLLVNSVLPCVCLHVHFVSRKRFCGVVETPATPLAQCIVTTCWVHIPSHVCTLLCSRQALQHGPWWTKGRRHGSPKLNYKINSSATFKCTKIVHSPITVHLQRPRHCHLLADQPEGKHITTYVVSAKLTNDALCNYFVAQAHHKIQYFGIHFFLYLVSAFHIKKGPCHIHSVYWN